jgi:tetratricopeptide (TPR) repeat protein
MATSLPSATNTNATRLADRYTPSTNETSKSLRRGTSADQRAQAARANASYPGESRRAAAARLSSSGRAVSAARKQAVRVSDARVKRAGRISNARGQHAERIERARERRATRIANARGSTKTAEQLAADQTSWQRLRNRYREARAQDPELEKKMAAASQGVAIASDLALRSSMGAAGFTGYGGASGSYGDRWGGYTFNDGYDSNGWSSWYWNSCWPFYNNWWFGCSSGFFPGWGWGWGNCYYWGYNPCWSWACYWPGYTYSWPTYAYCTPSVIYKYYEVESPVYEEVAEEPEEEVVVAAAPAPLQTPNIGQRAATEYMALGDRAFTEGRYGDAVHYYAKSIEFAPQDGVLYLVLSDALFATGDYHYAAFALKRSLELHPELASLGLDKRSFYGTPEDFDRHLLLLEKFVEDHVIDSDARLVLAANYVFSRQPERCVSMLDSAFSVDVKESSAGQLLMAASLELMAKTN